MTNKELLEVVTRRYLDSADFNGLPVSATTPRARVRQLIEKGLLSLNRGDRHPNFHIKAFEPEPIGEQLRKISEGGLVGCLYPERTHLESVLDRSEFEGRPYELALGLGAPKLSLRYFDPTVLEKYRNDPRYSFKTDGIQGYVSVSDEHYKRGSEEKVAERDQTLLQSFGFGYDQQMHRAVAVFLSYLAGLTPEHQRIWQAHELSGDFSPHPDYWAASMGHWPTHASIFVAFTAELRIINEMTTKIWGQELFRKDFVEDRPRDFAFMLRPTKEALDNFVHLLDKMLSDNIERRFFPPAFISAGRKSLGTLRLLEVWLDERFRARDPKPVARMFAVFRRVRELRMRPAHTIRKDLHDPSYFAEQRALMLDSYNAVRTLRLILANHPATRGVEIPDWLDQGLIRAF